MKGAKAIFIALLMVLSVVSFALAEDNATADVSTESNETPELTSASTDVEAENETLEDQTENITDMEEPQEVEIRAGAENETQAEPVSAENDTIEIPANETPSITPDQPFLWGLKRAIEKIDYLITLGKSAKAQKGLVHARERLLEVQAMIAAKKFDAAEKAAKAHEQTVEQVEADVEALGNGDAEKEIAAENQIQTEIQQQQQELAKIKNKVKAKYKGQDLAAAEAVLASFEGKTSEIEAKIVEKKNKALIRLKVEVAAKTKEQGKGEENQTEQKNKTKTQKTAINSTKKASGNSKGKGAD